MLSKKYYIEFAKQLKQSRDLAEFKEQLIAFCKGDNTRFNEAKFRSASENDNT